MTILSLFFYIFATVSVLSSILVVISKNPVHSVLFLILTFFNCSALFVLLGAEFLAMLLLIVYVGAVAVLFLFVVMMLNIDFATLRKGMSKNAPVGILVGLILFCEIVISIAGLRSVEATVSSFSYAETEWGQGGNKIYTPEGGTQVIGDESFSQVEIQNTRELGMVLYTQYAYLFQCAGFILLVAMIGAIVLTHRNRENVRRQKVVKQILKDRKHSVEVKKVDIGKGVSGV